MHVSNSALQHATYYAWFVRPLLSWMDTMALGTLTGYSLPMVGQMTDHTYVTSSNGHVWPCNGRFAGGQAICAGVGNVDQADCLALPNQSAGIRYGLDGLCHQMANRILFPAGQTVTRARGFRFSSTVFGAYGKSGLVHYSPPSNPWPELMACANHSHP